MGIAGNSKLPPLVELVHCPDIYAEEIGLVERVGGDCVRVWMVVNGLDAGRPARITVAKLIRPISMLVNRESVMALVDRSLPIKPRMN